MKKILLIEDNDDIRENTAKIIELANYNVLVSKNGKHGLETAIETRPDLIICDIMMPILDGYGVLHAVQKNDSIKNTPFIFLSAKSERDDFRKGMELGADDYISKPFEVTELLNAIDRRLKKNEIFKAQIAHDALDGIKDFPSLSTNRNILDSFTSGRYINSYEKKQKIYKEGGYPDSLYFIIKGKVKTYKTNDDGKELVTELFKEGDFLGYIPLLEGGSYKDFAEAIEVTELALIPKAEFIDLLEKNNDVAQKFIKLLAHNIADKEAHLLGIAYNSLRKKVAEALIMLQKKYRRSKSEKFVIDITRESLATIAGTATESLIRTLGDFKSEKLIEMTDGKILILDQVRMERLVN